ncbi:MAG: oligosaccharide flippase family protein, partial [Pseudomonadota bacterium]
MTRFAKHLGAYSVSEVAAKLSRLTVVLVIARVLSVEAIGLVAAAMAASDLFKAFTENGVTQRIIRAGATELAATCRRAHAIYWVWCGGLFVIQVAFAVAFGWYTGNTLIAAMIALLAVEYLFMPGGLVNCALAMRDGRMSETAAIAGGQIVGANLATAALVLIWPSPFAIILPKVLSAIFWLVAMRRLRPWQSEAVQAAKLGPFFRFGAAILGGEVLKAARLQADKLVVGGLLGAEALGVWFFAVNAGLGLANSFGTAFGTVLFPHLCASANPVRTLRRTLGMAL